MTKFQECKVHAKAIFIAIYPSYLLSLATIVFALLESDLWLFTFLGTFYFFTFGKIEQKREHYLKKHLPNW